MRTMSRTLKSKVLDAFLIHVDYENVFRGSTVTQCLQREGGIDC